MSAKTMINDMTHGSVAKKLIHFSVPYLVANLLQMVYSLVDMMFVGHANGSVGLTAVSIGSQLIMLYTQIGAGVATGSQIIISQLVGAQKKEKLQATIGTSLTAFAIMSVVLGGFSAIFYKVQLNWMNTPAEAFDQTAQYLVVCSLGMFFIYGYNAICGVLRGMGDSVHPLIFVGIATVANIALDFVFVILLKTGALGAAIATVLGQAIAFGYSLVFLYKRKERFGFDFKRSSFAIDMGILKSITKLAVPLAFQNVAVTISMLYMNAWVNTCGLAAAAAAGVGRQLQGIVAMMTGAFTASAAAMVGQNVGAGKPDRVKQVVYYSWGICLIFAVIFTLLFLFCPVWMFSLFTSDPEVLALAPGFLRVCIVMVFAFALMSPVLGFTNGVGNANLNMVAGILDGVVARIGLSLLFGHFMNWGLNGYFLGNGLAGYVTVFICAGYFFSGKWKKRVPVLDKK